MGVAQPHIRRLKQARAVKFNRSHVLPVDLARCTLEEHGFVLIRPSVSEICVTARSLSVARSLIGARARGLPKGDYSTESECVERTLFAPSAHFQ